MSCIFSSAVFVLSFHLTCSARKVETSGSIVDEMIMIVTTIKLTRCASEIGRIICSIDARRACTMWTSDFGEMNWKNLHSAVEMNCVTTFFSSISSSRCGTEHTKKRNEKKSHARSVQISQFVQSLILVALSWKLLPNKSKWLCYNIADDHVRCVAFMTPTVNSAFLYPDFHQIVISHFSFHSIIHKFIRFQFLLAFRAKLNERGRMDNGEVEIVEWKFPRIQQKLSESFELKGSSFLRCEWCVSTSREIWLLRKVNINTHSSI